MREVFGAFGSEVFRPLMTLLAPGAVSLVPWLIALMQRYPAVYAIVNENRTEAGLSLSFIALMIGMLVEAFGGHLEAKILDPALDRATEGKHLQNWFTYLRVAFRTEPIGANYIRRIILRMRFELGMAGACLIGGFGALATNLDLSVSGLIAITALGLSAILFWEARNSHGLLSNTRGLLLQGLILLGDPKKDDPADSEST